jgi:serralysin
MATKQWTASGDWFSTQWLDTGTAQASGPPGAGDTGIIFSGGVTITAADAVAHPTIDGVTLRFASQGAGTVPTLDATDVQFGSGCFIDNELNAHAARVIARGTVGLAGTLSGDAAATAPLTLDIESASGAATFTSTGTVEADNAGSLLVTGTVGAVFANDGLVLASDGTVDIATALVNGGTILNSGGVLTLAGGVTNNGTIADQSGTIGIGGGVSGSGSIVVDQEVDIAGTVANGQVVSFGSNDAMLRLSDAAGFHGSIAGLTAHDVIDLQGVIADHTTYDSGSGVLTVFDGATQVASLTVSGLSGALGVASDNFGGSILTLEQPGTPTQVAAFMVANSADGEGAHTWPTPDPIITYTFDSASNWSTAEQAAFQNAMALWSDVANVRFQQVTSGSADVDWVRGSDGQAFTNSSFSGGIDTAATISIDTSVASWANLSAIGTADPTGFGGYGFLTVLHELGHALGLGHPGPYNETANITQQIFYTDTHQYSVMSYFGAAESGADWTLDATVLNAQTPMLYDIAAVQDIYGANTSSLTGGDTFGFKSTFGTASVHPLREYDFTQDTTPVVTLYDGGPNNTLDLSGFSASSTVDLVPGSFSSADGMSDNIAIADDTTIDSAVGGSGNDAFVVNGGNDTIDGGGGTNFVVFGGDFAQYAFARNGATLSVTGLGATDVLTNVATLDFADAVVAADVACFAQATRILTADGPVAVEDLHVGMAAVTRDGRAAPIRWVGHRDVNVARHPRPWDVRPVRVRAGAIARGVPERDVLLSPDHALALSGVLVPARYLVNGATILADDSVHRVRYFHVELDRHDVLLAEGMACESFLDTGNRGAFANAGVVDLHAEFARRVWEAEACAPLVVAGGKVARLHRRLMHRAETLGFERTTDPAVRVVADGRPRVRRDGDSVTVGVPRGAHAIRIVSRTWVPLQMCAEPHGDARRLGVAVADVRLDDVPVALHDPRLSAGWHAAEADFRWTGGNATLDVSGARKFAFRLASTGIYWRDPSETVEKARVG